MKPIALFPLALALVAALFACSGEVASSPSSLAGAPTASVVDPVVGIADPGDDPAVLAIESSGAILCAGSLIAPDVVLTARHCVLLHVSSLGAAVPNSCVAEAPEALRDPVSLAVHVGKDGADSEPRAYGRAILVPAGSLCGADLAVLMLDRTIDDVEPLAVRATGVAQGDHVRTVGFGPWRGAAGTEIVRDHADVLETNATEFRVRESACEEGCGGPAMDESTGQIVGVLSGAGASPGPGNNDAANAAPWDVGTRADAFSTLIARALGEGAPTVNGGGRAKTKKGPVDTGANCESGFDCSAGVCVTDASRQYCSRACGAHDRCPARFRCEKTGGPGGAPWVCIES